MQPPRVEAKAQPRARWLLRVTLAAAAIMALILSMAPSLGLPSARALTPSPAGTPPGTPDLVVGYVRVSTENSISCEPSPLGLRVEIRNIGTAIANPGFIVEANGARQTVNPTWGVGPNQSYVLWFPSYVSPGPNVVTVDVTNVIAESDESNNSVSTQVAIPTQNPPCTPDPNATATRTATTRVGCGSTVIATNTRTNTRTATPSQTSTASPTRTPTRTNTACGVIYITPTLSADFSASPRTGTAPLNVTFNALGAAGAESCTWWYGDGTAVVFDWSCPSTHTHVYSAPGSYTVRLHMAGVANDITKTDYIVVEPGTGSPTATRTGTATSTRTPTRTATGPSCLALFCTPAKINFQPASAPTYPGYVVDGGAVYGARGNGYTYGWNVDNTGWARDRNAANSADQRYDTLNHMQKGAGSVWELAIPNGTWNVRIVAGDPLYNDSVYNITAEGVTVVSGTPNSTTRWFDGNKSVTVADGKLTIANGPGSSNNKINFIEIAPATPPTFTPTRTPTGTTTARLKGYVRQNSASGPGLAGVNVCAYLASYTFNCPDRATTTDQNGYYELTICTPGQENVTVQASKSGYTITPAYHSFIHYGGCVNAQRDFVATTGGLTPTPPTATPSPSTGPCCGVEGSISMPSIMGGYQGDTIMIPVAFSASGTSPVTKMRVRAGGGACATDLSASAWEPFVTSKSYPYSVPINFSSFYVTVQYQDMNTHVSPLYCGRTTVEGMPRPTPPTATPVTSVPSTLKVQYRAAETAGTANQIKPYLSIVNTGSASVPLSELTVRYWYTADGTQGQAFACDWAQIGCANIAGSFVRLPAARTGADSYLEVKLSGTGSLGGGTATGEIQIRFNKSDWTNYTQTGDYSFDPTKTAFADWSRVTLYRNGTLVWGAEP